MNRKTILAYFMFAVCCQLLCLPTTVAGALLHSQQQQTKRISGHVESATGAVLPGATISFPGSDITAITDQAGNFVVTVPTHVKRFKVSLVGMMAQEVEIGIRTNFQVILESESVQLEEAVVVGYGVQKKESVVAAITKVDQEQLLKRGNVTDLKQALSGQIPGLTAITSSGEPGGVGRNGSATQLFLRGQNTWNGAQPLILVDNVERAMENVDVNEVESVSVLKDASATAVYGVKGANGVILITTKRGKASKPSVSVTYNSTAKMLSKLPETMDSYAAWLIKNETIEREVVLNESSWADYRPYEIIQRYQQPQNSEYAMVYPNVDWQKALFKDVGMSHKAALNISGGSDNIRYFGSLAYLHEGDMFRDYNNNKGYDPSYAFDRFNFRSNLDIDLTPSTLLKVNLAGFTSIKNQTYANEGSAESADYMMWASVYGFPPDAYLPQYEDGSWGYSNRINLWNPVATLYNLGVRKTRQTLLSSTFELQQKLDFLTKGLTAKGFFMYDNDIFSESGLYDITNHVRPNETTSNTPEKQINPDDYWGPGQDPSEYIINLPTVGQNGFDWVSRPWAVRPEVVGTGNFSDWIPVTRRMVYQFQLEYARQFALHDISAMTVMKRDEYARGNMFKNYREDWVFRTTYNYDARYMLEFNGAYNGSEQFGPGYRFDFFPSFAAGWNVSNEKFFKVSWIDRLKMRYSLGFVGNDNVGSARWLYSSQWTYGGSSPLGSLANTSSPYTWYRQSQEGNPDIRWEKAKKQNFGLELGMLKNALSVNFDYFIENRSDILLVGNAQSIPSFYGGVPATANLGKVDSKGFELEVKWDKRLASGWRYWSTVALARTQNVITFRDDPELLPDYLKAQGYPVGQKRTAMSAGYYNNWDEVYASIPTETNDLYKLPGYHNLIDFNADGIYKSSEDNVPYGYPDVPMNTYSLFLGGDYKGFGAMVQFFGSYNTTRNIPLDNFMRNFTTVFSHVEDYWSKDNQDASSFLPRWKTVGENIGEYYMYDASYLRLKTVELAYTFQNKMNWLQRMGIDRLRVYVNGSDLYLWSDLPDDREGTASGGSATRGTYPTVKRVNFGIDLTL